MKMPKADTTTGMDFLALPINADWPAQKGEAPRLAGQFGRFVKVQTKDGRVEARIQVRIKG